MQLDPMQLAIGITVIIGALTALGVFFRGFFRMSRRLLAFVDEVTGEPAAYGRPPKPGLVEKVDTIGTTQDEHTSQLDALRRDIETVKHELFPNSGMSLRDAVDRLERQASVSPTVVNVNPPHTPSESQP